MRVLLVVPMPRGRGRGRDSGPALRRAAGPQRAPRGDAGDRGRRRARAKPRRCERLRGGGRGPRRRPPPAAAGPRRRRRQLRLAATWARGRWPWRTVWYAEPGIQAVLDRLGGGARLRRRRGRGQRDVGLPLSRRRCRRVFTHHEVLRPRPVDWRPGSAAAAGRAGPSASSTGGAGRASSGGPGDASTGSRSSAAATPRRSPSWRRRWRRGSGSTPSASCFRRPPTPIARCRGRCSSSATSPTRPTATRRSGWRGEIMPAVRERAPRGAAADRRHARRRPRSSALAGPRRRGGRRRAQRPAPPRSGGGGAGAGADRRRDADEGAAGDGGRQGGGDHPARHRGLRRLRRGAAAGVGRRARRRSPRRRAALLGGRRAAPRARRAGRAQFAERHHSPEAWAERLTAVYEEARAARAGRRRWLSRPRSASSSRPTSVARRCGGRCESLAAQTADPDSYEVVVADRRLDRRHAEMLEAFEAPLRAAPGRSRPGAAGPRPATPRSPPPRGEVLIVLDDDMRAVARVRRAPPLATIRPARGAACSAPSRSSSDGASPHAARYVKEKFDLHLRAARRPRAPRPAALLLHRQRLAADRGDARGRRLRRVVRHLRQRGRRAGAAAARAPGSSSATTPRRSPTRNTARSCGASQRDTLGEGPDDGACWPAATPRSSATCGWPHRDDSSRPWLAVRAALLAADPAACRRRRPRSSRCARCSSALGLWRAPLFYRAVLDYAFWAGVDAALRESNDEGELRTLAGELRRGPIDLLLHR